MTTSRDYAQARKALRVKINTMPEGPIKIVSKQVDSCLRLLAKNPNDKAAEVQLRKNSATFEGLKAAVTSEE